MPSDVTAHFHGELLSLRRFVEKQRQQVQTIVVAYGWTASEAVIPIASGAPDDISKAVGVTLAKLAISDVGARMACEAVQIVPPVGGQGHERYFHLDRTAALLQMLDDVKGQTPGGVHACFALSKGAGGPSVGLAGDTGDLFKVLLFVCARLFSESPGSRHDVLRTIRRAATMPDNPLHRSN